MMINLIDNVNNIFYIRVPMKSLASNYASGYRLLNTSGEDVTAKSLERIQSTCPELLDLVLQAPLFTPPQPSPEDTNILNTPAAMAKLFNVPYLGKLPMDPNMMYACEKGVSFLENFPNSPAADPFTDIVDKLIQATIDIKQNPPDSL
jgi:hypothetical protein